MIGPKNKFFNVLLILLAMSSPTIAQIPVSWWDGDDRAGWPENYWVEQGVVLAVSEYCDSLSLLDKTYRIEGTTAFFTADWRRLTPVEFAAGIVAGQIDERVVVWSEAGKTSIPVATKVQAVAGATQAQRFALIERNAKGRSFLHTARPARALIDEFGDEHGAPIIDFLGQVLQQQKIPQPGDQVSLLLHEGAVVRVKLLGRPALPGYRVGLDASVLGAKDASSYLTLAR
ncbi:MAG: hypothetical protein ACI906_003189 [Candidatus Latescibacterota bacterium]|jgi:hypothetical protein